jgi:hypothetical protein
MMVDDKCFDALFNVVVENVGQDDQYVMPTLKTSSKRQVMNLVKDFGKMMAKNGGGEDISVENLRSLYEVLRDMSEQQFDNFIAEVFERFDFTDTKIDFESTQYLE